MIYRILTENINKDEVLKIVNEKFNGYTVYEGVGVWQGKREGNLTIEIDTLGEVGNLQVYHVAYAIKDLNKQECVLVQKIASDSKLI